MRYTVLLYFVLVYAACLGQGKMERDVLTLPGKGMFFYVTAQGKPMLIGRDRSVFRADSIDGLWRGVALANGPGEFERVDQCDFFDDSTGFLSGYISNGSSQHNIIYRTTDAGASWETVDFGQDGWVDGTCSLDDGQAWMSVSGKGIAYTNNRGATWTALPIVTTNNQRYGAMFFNARKEGIVGSMWNAIGYTPDNCQHWQRIPTPLEQKKYNKTDKGARPEILRVAIFKDYFLANQENMVFATKRDSINWVPLTGYTDFRTDGNNSALFMLSERDQVVRMDDALQPVAFFPSQAHIRNVFCRNGDLYTFNGSKIKRFSIDNTVLETALEIDQPAGDYPVTFAYSGDYLRYGAIGRRIYLGYAGDAYDEMDNNTWRYLLTLPFAVSDSSTLSYESEQSQIICRRPNDSLYYYNIYYQTVRATTVHDMIKDFAAVRVDTVTVTHGSQGCFHGYSDIITYVLSETQYRLISSRALGTDHKKITRGRQKNFDASVVQRLVQQLCDNYNRLPVFDDLGFTMTDVERCKRDILDFKNASADKIRWDWKGFYFSRNNIDFDRLLRMVDSATYIAPGRLRDVFIHPGNFSTTSSWVTVRFVNAKGAVISLSYGYYEANAFCLPWIITIDGVTVRCMSLSVTDFVRQICPSMIPANDRVSVLHEIVKAVYLR